MKNIYIRKEVREPNIEPVPATKEEMKRLMMEQEDPEIDLRRYNESLKGNVLKLQKVCNELGEIILASQSYEEFMQALTNARTWYRFYSVPYEPKLEEYLNDLAFLIKQGDERKEILQKQVKPAFPILRPNILAQIYQVYELLCRNEYIDCDFAEYKHAIETANFKYFVKKGNASTFQYSAFRLQTILGDSWYSATCSNMSWSKQTCNSRNPARQIKLGFDKIVPKAKE